MKISIQRRRFLQRTAGLAAAGFVSTFPGKALPDSSSFVAVEWGGEYIKATKQIAAAWGKSDIDWVLVGSGAEVLAKVKAQWPNPPFDVVANWDPVFATMIREDWLETIAEADIPNLKNIPEDLILKDKAGNWKTAPRSLSGSFFGYRKDTCPVQIKSIDDLLDERLKGQLVWPAPVNNGNVQMLALALHGGGNERNMEPAWEFMTKLAKSGNIGSVISGGDPEFVNAMTTGQASAGFFDATGWSAVAENFPCKFLTKVPDQPGLKFFFFTVGWCVLKGTRHKQDVMDFINFGLSPEMDQMMTNATKEIPTNPKASPPKGMEFMTFNPQELKQYAYRPDWDYMSTQADAWQKRFETEIMPLLGR
ncbi:extracellular solute-binding protein [Mesorhizobium australicum]|uniref:ABC transporter substrate-binding protein n=1 Tax=Mesorhizobium australicum TaxID=536018 RepID=UPI0033398254